MREFIKLQLKLKWGLNRDNSKVSAALTAVAAALAIALVLALVWVLTFVLKGQVMGITPKRLSVLFLTLIAAVLTFGETGMQIKRLYKPGDIKITARFPLSPFKVFVSYLILNYIDLSIYSAVSVIPVMLVSGFAMQCITAAYIGGIILGVIFMPVIPFALSVLISIPVMYVSALLEKHGIVRLVIFVIFLAGCFVLYNYILSNLAQFFIHRNWEEGTLEIWAKLLAGLDFWYNPAFYTGNIIFFEKFWASLGITIGAGAVIAAAGIALARIVYEHIRNKAVEGSYHIYGKTTSPDGYSDSRAILRYGFKEILRTRTYSYFYLGVAISTPVMIFFCNNLTRIIGEWQIGQGISFGASMLVTAVFMAMICSFAAAILSVEGKNFYITKLVPVPYKKQLIIKGLLYFGVSVVALAISLIVIVALEFITALEAIVLASTGIMLALGLVFNGINLNLANPNLKPKANGEAEEINITFMLVIGLILAALLGAAGIIMPRSLPNGTMWAYITAIVGSFVYALINIIVFLYTADKKYRKIEV